VQLFNPQVFPAVQQQAFEFPKIPNGFATLPSNAVILPNGMLGVPVSFPGTAFAAMMATSATQQPVQPPQPVQPAQPAGGDQDQKHTAPQVPVPVQRPPLPMPAFSAQMMSLPGLIPPFAPRLEPNAGVHVKTNNTASK